MRGTRDSGVQRNVARIRRAASGGLLYVHQYPALCPRPFRFHMRIEQQRGHRRKRQHCRRERDEAPAQAKGNHHPATPRADGAAQVKGHLAARRAQQFAAFGILQQQNLQRGRERKKPGAADKAHGQRGDAVLTCHEQQHQRQHNDQVGRGGNA